MALTVTEVEELRAYVQGVMERADHHAGAVKHIVLALAGAILWRKEDDQPIKVMTGKAGQPTNVLWVHIGGSRYAFSYDHGAGTIEMREGSTQGPTLHSFTNKTPLSDVYNIFEKL
jgi:hypothetical protein